MNPIDRAMKRYETVRRQIEWEDGLFNQRFTWLMALQAFLLFPFVSLNVSEAISPLLTVESRETFYFLKCLTASCGLIACALTYTSCVTAVIQIRRLTLDYQRRSAADDKSLLPSIQSSVPIAVLSLAASHGLMFLLAIIWSVCLLRLHPRWQLLVWAADTWMMLMLAVECGLLDRRFVDGPAPPELAESVEQKPVPSEPDA